MLIHETDEYVNLKSEKCHAGCRGRSVFLFLFSDTHSALELVPRNVVSRLCLGGVVTNNSLPEDLSLALREVALAPDRDRVRDRVGEGDQKGDTNEDCEDTLKLQSHAQVRLVKKKKIGLEE